jgi:hypothetical protein
MKKKVIQLSSLLLIILCSCVHIPTDSAASTNSSKDSVVMNTTVQANSRDVIKPRLSAEQALQSVMTLIRTNKNVSEFTPERLNEAFQTDVQYAKNDDSRYGSGEAISPDWNYGFYINKKVKDLQGKLWSKFVFSFNPINADANPDIGAVCAMNFDTFSKALEAQGFKRERRYAEHDRWLYDEFNNATMRIHIYIQNRENAADAGAGGERPQACIKMIEIL